MRVQNNIAAFKVFYNYTRNISDLRASMRKLSSGLRIQRAGDDPSGLAVSERLRAQYRNTAAAASNVENKINYLQTTDSWLRKIQDMMGRMSEIAVMANDGTKSLIDRENLQREFEQLQHEIQRITSGNTAAGKFNGLYLFRGGTGVASMQGDLVEGFPTRARGHVANLTHDGSGISASTWKATYDEIAEVWTVVNETTGTVEGTIAAAPDEGGGIALEGANGFRFWFDAPRKGTFGTGDTFTWTNVPYTNPVMGLGMGFTNRNASNARAVTQMMGTGSGVSTSDWSATYDAAAGLWTIRNETTSTVAATVAAGPEEGGTVDLEGANGFRLNIQAPADGSYATGDRLLWNNTAYVLPVMGSPVLQDAGGVTSGSAQAVMLGDGMGLSTSGWSATYNAETENWTVRNESTGTDVGTISAAPNAGGTLANIEGANGFTLNIAAPTGGTQYTMGDRFTWNNQGYVAPVLGGAMLSDNRTPTAATANAVRQGDGSGLTTAAWSATYDALAHQWTVRNESTGTDVGTISAAPNAGGTLNNIQGVNGFNFTVNAPTGGTQYTHGDRFDWTNQAYIAPVLGATGFSDSSVPTTATASAVQRGNGTGVSSANWRATYDAVARQWTVRNLTTGTNVGIVSAAPDAGGGINLEGANGFRFTVNAPTGGTQYTMGDQYNWSNTAYVAPVLGGTSFHNAGPATGGSSGTAQLGSGAGITTANWSAVYDAVTEQWTIRNETTGTDVGTLSAAPDAGGSMDLEGANGFRFTINAPSSGAYDTGDRFTWSNTAAVAAGIGSPSLTDNTQATTGTCATAQRGDGDGISSADWRATYDAVARQWTVRNLTTGTNVGTVSAAPDAGGGINLEGANGFRLTINAPTTGVYTTGDHFTWTNTAHTEAATGGTSLTDDRTPTTASAGSVQRGDGSTISTANWRARYDAVAEEWTIRNLSTGTNVGTLSAAPNAGGSINLEGANGFRFTINAPASGLYNTGDAFYFNNVRHVDPATGSTTLNDDTTPTNGSADVVYRGDGTSVTTAGWDAVYDAVARQWTIRNLTTATVEGTLSASPLSGGTIDFEGPNGFRLTIDAPAGGAYNTGDRFIWSNQEHVPPVVRTGHYAPAGLPGSGAAVTREGDGYDVSASSWRATYDAEDREWTVRNTTTGQTVGTLSAAPDAGGTLSNIEGADGFALTISAPTSGTYSTGDYFTWQNEEHIQAFPGIAEYTDIDQESVSLQVGPDSNQVFREEPIVLEADYYKIIGSYVTYRYGSVNMTLLGSTPTAVTWASLICPQELSVSAQAQAQAAVDKLNIGIDHLSALSATVGAELNRMEQTLSGLRNYEENIRSTESRIRDVDIAWETTKFAKYQLLAQFSTSILAQANAISAGVLELLR